MQDQYTIEFLQRQIELNNKYTNKKELVLAKRSVSTGMQVCNGIRDVEFDEIEMGIYLKTNSKEILCLVKKYEYMIEEAFINKENFFRKLHEFYLQTGKYILEHDIRDFFELFTFCVSQIQVKSQQNVIKVFNAYLSLIINQFLYLAHLQGDDEALVCGCTTEGKLMMVKDPFAYSDYPSFECGPLLYKNMKKNKNIDEIMSEVSKSYKKYGFIIDDPIDIERLEQRSRMYSNNIFDMCAYIDENTKDMIPTKPLKLDYMIVMPRQWKRTETYKERLKRRNYTLANEGVTGRYNNTPFVKEIKFKEILQYDTVILLYKILTKNDEELSGYYNTSTGYFYSPYENSTGEEWHWQLENFVLENYCFLTCKIEVDRKRNSALKIKETEEEKIFPYKEQPVVYFYYRKTSVKNGEKRNYHYDRSKYTNEKQHVDFYIRKLPEGYKISDEAMQYATQLGYELEERYTIVRPFEKNVRKIKAL